MTAPGEALRHNCGTIGGAIDARRGGRQRPPRFEE
jgi:hypothetical protein